MKIRPEEVEIVGGWSLDQGRMEADASSVRINELTRKHLRQLGRDASGWDVLFVDPDDGRYWERTHPQSEMHGGGPPLLRCLSDNEARQKYGDGVLTGRDCQT